jgi:hypothetical protein
MKRFMEIPKGAKPPLRHDLVSTDLNIEGLPGYVNWAISGFAP